MPEIAAQDEEEGIVEWMTEWSVGVVARAVNKLVVQIVVAVVPLMTRATATVEAFTGAIVKKSKSAVEATGSE